MIGLIYPAVLGSLLYSAIQTVVDPAMSAITGEAQSRFSAAIGFKVFLLGIVIMFFICDYLYIMFTNQLRAWLFAADCVFIVLMYIVWWAVDIRGADRSEARLGVILICLLTFMGVYWLWDWSELRTASGDERRFYVNVIRWEIGSIAALAVIGSLWLLGFHWPRFCVVVLLVISVQFARLAWRKRRFAT
jgi:hypothetical protein